MNHITRETAREAIQGAVRYRLDELINPSDVMDGADTWEEVPHEMVVDECSQSADIILNEQQNTDIMVTIDELCASMVADSLARVPNHALADDWTVPNLIRKARVWPYETNRTTMWECVIETDRPFRRMYPTEWSEARMVAHDAIKDEMASFHPDS